ncbi:ABC transporter permease subunit [Paenibacillus sp. HJGM_3]|uniref:ABC transporter permease subunit n=1 Tax=Paenibacillus sp. HJGM_3 TaxID=3379816 RepID=UPI00385C0A28
MQSFRAGFVNEVWLMVYRKKGAAFILVSALLPVLLALGLSRLQPYLGLMAISGSFPVQMLSLYAAFWLPLFIISTTADLFPNEVASRTLKLAFLRPNTRLQVFLSKVAALGAGIAAQLAVLGIVTLLIQAIAGSSIPLSEWVKIGLAYAAAFLAMLALSALFVFVSQWFRSAGGFIVFAIFLYVAAKIAPFFVGSVSAFSPFSYTGWHVLWLSGTVSAGKLVTSGLFLLSCCGLFFSLGYYIFDRKEG